MPEPSILAAASLPEHLDLFRRAGWTTRIVASAHMAEAVRRLALDGVTFRELALR